MTVDLRDNRGLGGTAVRGRISEDRCQMAEDMLGETD